MPEHNPRNLTPAQVGNGYRLLDEDEIWHAKKWVVEGWAGWWQREMCGNSKNTTYRTHMTREQLRKAREQ